MSSFSSFLHRRQNHDVSFVEALEQLGVDEFLIIAAVDCAFFFPVSMALGLTALFFFCSSSFLYGLLVNSHASCAPLLLFAAFFGFGIGDIS